MNDTKETKATHEIKATNENLENTNLIDVEENTDIANLEIGEDTDTVSGLDKTLASVCKVCNNQATDKKRGAGRTSLNCHICSGLIHLQCTRLPAYMLYTLSTSTKRYVCEDCSATPPQFAQNITVDDTYSIPKQIETTTSTISPYAQLESKVDYLSEKIDKFNLSRVADSIQTTYAGIGKMNNIFKENISILEKSRVSLQKILDSQRTTMDKDIEDQNKKIAILETSVRGNLDRETALLLECQNLKGKVEAKDIIIKQLTDIVQNFHQTTKPTAPHTTSDATGGDAAAILSVVKNPTVVIFHDSLCRTITQNMMIRENVTIEKKWAPTLGEIIEQVGVMEPTDRIVVQSLTREVPTMSTDEFTTRTFEVVEKCLTKAPKVVVSLIVERDDNAESRAKAEAANALIKLKYIDNENVLVCHHDNLRDKRYRKEDQLHLTDPGTSRLANNLKYKIAESLKIDVIKKKNNELYNRNENYNRREREYNRHNRRNNYGENDEWDSR